ncbi:MAG: OmpA/MotB family protein [Planctomycetota bacterium]|jgi:chemotaxis protein MotB
MQTIGKKSIVLLICVFASSFLTGCTDWKKKYNALNVEYQNLRGLYESAMALKGQLEGEIANKQMTIEDLQKQINERGTVETGFPGDVKFDPAAGTITVTLQNSILFNSGKAVLKNKSSSELNQIQSVLQSQYVGKMVDVVGHTDSDPIKKSKWKDNWELSSQRSLTVTRYLIKGGIPEDRIRAVGRGASQPVASNSTASGKAANRRVEIVVYMK